MAARVKGGYRCNACGETKPRSGFYVAKGRMNGLSHYCRPCTVAKQRPAQRRRNERDKAARHARGLKKVGVPKVWTRAKLIAALRSSPDAPPRVRDWDKATSDHPTFGAVVREFGSWNAGVRAAGFEPRPSGAQPGNGNARRAAA